MPKIVSFKEVFGSSEIREEFKSNAIAPQTIKKTKTCCFKKNPYIYQVPKSMLKNITTLKKAETQNMYLMITNKHNIVVVNHALKCLLEYFDGTCNLNSLFRRLENSPNDFVLNMIGVSPYGSPCLIEKKIFTIQRQLEKFVLLVKALCEVSLIHPVGFSTAFGEPPSNKFRLDTKTDVEARSTTETQVLSRGNAPLSPVLLLAANTGQAPIGVLYLASYLYRNGIKTFCQFNDFHFDYVEMSHNIQTMLGKIKPKLVGVSLKWFPHIARGLEICKLIKQHTPEVKTVLGGDTATYFSKELIANRCVDYIICGDGELPLLKLSLGEEDIPNCICKQDTQTYQIPITYVHTKCNNSDTYLSNLDEILTSKIDIFNAPYIFIFTGQGCSMNCHYCAGSSENQQRIFNRKSPYLRSIETVQKDILQLKNYTSTLMFDFDPPYYNSIGYYRKIWEGLNLRSHFVCFYFWNLPSEEFIYLITKTFNYAYLNIDLCGLSERHRLYLASLGIVKPQPTNAQIFSLFDMCEKYDNVEVSLNLIMGLPYLIEEDIKEGDDMLSHIVVNYACFKSLNAYWFHAQPGAPITYDYGKFNMSQGATTYEDYLEYSILNLKKHKYYPDDHTLNYPLIKYKNQRLNHLAKNYFENTVLRINNDLEKRGRNRHLGYKQHTPD